MIRNSSSDKEAKTIDCFWLQASRSTARIVIDVDQAVPLTYLNRLPGVRMDAVLAHVAERTACELLSLLKALNAGEAPGFLWLSEF